MGYIYENAQIIDNHGTLLHTTVFEKMFVKRCIVLALARGLMTNMWRNRRAHKSNASHVMYLARAPLGAHVFTVIRIRK